MVWLPVARTAVVGPSCGSVGTIIAPVVVVLAVDAARPVGRLHIGRSLIVGAIARRRWRRVCVIAILRRLIRIFGGADAAWKRNGGESERA
jgi:hypothetical protein